MGHLVNMLTRATNPTPRDRSPSHSQKQSQSGNCRDWDQRATAWARANRAASSTKLVVTLVLIAPFVIFAIVVKRSADERRSISSTSGKSKPELCEDRDSLLRQQVGHEDEQAYLVMWRRHHHPTIGFWYFGYGAPVYGKQVGVHLEQPCIPYSHVALGILFLLNPRLCKAMTNDPCRCQHVLLPYLVVVQ